jgi:chaperonin cofactor prefoldin
MKLRVFATLLMAFTLLISSVSPAQMQWGMGAYAGMQPCAGISNAAGASDEDDETAELKQDRSDLRREKRDLEKTYRQQERDLDNLRDSITDVVKPQWATVIFQHMDNKMNCQVCGVVPGTRPQETTQRPPPPTGEPPVLPAPPRDTSTRTVVEEEVPLPPQPPIVRTQPAPEPAQSFPVRPQTPDNSRPLPPVVNVPPPEVPPVSVKPPRKPRPSKLPAPVGEPSDGASVARTSSRMPASEVSAGSGVKTTPATAESFGDGFSEGFDGNFMGGDGSPTLCNPDQPPYRTPQWRAICRDNGKISAQACTIKGFQVGGIKGPQANTCGRALDRYARLVTEMEKAQNRLAKIDEEIDKIGYQLKDIKMAERANRELEADCPSGKCYERGSTRERKSRAPSIGQTLLSLAPALIGGFVGYKAASAMGHEANAFNRDTGNQAVPLSPYLATGMMSGIAAGLSYPFAAGGF